MATTAYPNPFLLSADNGTINSPWYLQQVADSVSGTLTAANACLAKDAAYTDADYKVVNGPTNQMQWLEPDDSTTVGSPLTGTAFNMANPPLASVYSLAPIDRTLLSPTLHITIS